MPYGYLDEKWEELKKAARKIMIAAARKERTITYTDIAAKLGNDLQPHESPLWNLLGEVAEAENAAGRSLLSAVVVLKDKGIPGSGFFDLASKLGRDVKDEVAFFSEELKKVHKHWSVTDSQ